MSAPPWGVVRAGGWLHSAPAISVVEENVTAGCDKKSPGQSLFVSAHIAEDIHARLVEEVAKRDVSLTWLINRILDRGIDDLHPIDL